jgi:Tol biopolymer transport system component
LGFSRNGGGANGCETLTAVGHDRRYCRRGWRTLWFVCLALTAGGLRAPAGASCNQIPGTVNRFRGAVGTVDRPFARPGDRLAIRIGPCDPDSPDFDADAAAHVVTIAFRPPAGPANLVVLAADCAARRAELDACAARPEIDRIECQPLDGAVAVRAGEYPSLELRFPDTDTWLDGVDDDRTLTGPAALIVTRANQPLPCGLARTPCARQPAGLTACIDTLYATAGQCHGAAHETFGSFTALPPPNDFQALCVDSTRPCRGDASELHFAVDAAGNLLLPMDWRGVLPQQALPIARVLRVVAALPAFGGDQAVRLHVPEPAFLHSYSPAGGLLPPVFEPQVDVADANRLVLFGTADAPETVLRIAQRSPSWRQCAGGAAPGAPCDSAAACPGGACVSATCRGGAADGADCSGDADCPDGSCGAALFEYRDQLRAGVGPVVVPRYGPGLCEDALGECVNDADCASGRCVSYRLSAEQPVPIEGMIDSPDLFITVVPESIEHEDLNGDGDQRDDVILISDRHTGQRQPIGVRDAPGRAATRLRDLPFSYPAVASQGRFTAFLEAEPLQGTGDLNGDGDQFDSVLRLYRGEGATAQDLLAGRNFTADAAPLIDGRALAFGEGLLWFRHRAADDVPLRLSRVSLASDGSQANGLSRYPALSADGRHVAFESSATNLAADAPLGSTAYVHDRDRGATTAVRVVSDLVPPGLPAARPSLSGDGSSVAVAVPDASGTPQVFVVERDADGNGVLDEPQGTASVAISALGDELGDGPSGLPVLSPDARYVAYVSRAIDLPRAGGSKNLQVRVRDRDPDGTGIFDQTFSEWVANSRDPDGLLRGNDQQQAAPAITPDGRFAAFGSFDQNLPQFDINDHCVNLITRHTCADVLVADHQDYSIDLVSAATSGVQGNSHSLSPAISADGRYVAFTSYANNLVPDDTNGVGDVFVYDRRNRAVDRVSVASDGTPGDAPSANRVVAISADGRTIAFGSTASTLVAGDQKARCDTDFDGRAEEPCSDIYLHDRVTGFTRRVTQTSAGGPGNATSTDPALSASGEVVGFESEADNLVAGDTNVTCPGGAGGAMRNCRDVFVAEPDLPADDGGATLQVLDTADASPQPQTIAAATRVAVHDRCAAFLTPEVAVGTSLNADADAADEVVQLYCARDAAGMRSLGRAARDVALGARLIAVRVPERDEGSGSLNGDNDLDDAVVQVSARRAPQAWVNLGQAADEVAVEGDVVAFLTDETAQREDLNRDGDNDDRVVQVWFAAADGGGPLAGELVNTGLAAEEFVLGPHLLALRSRESAQRADMNRDRDLDDAVLWVLDLATRELVNTGQAATPCRFAACDARQPYRVGDDTVRFLTLELAQGKIDLSGNDSLNDVVLQTFNLRQRAVQASLRVSAAAAAPTPSLGVTRPIGAISAGICSDTGQACATVEDCEGPDGQRGNAVCYAPPGVCVVDRQTPCQLEFATNSCADGQFCVPSAPGVGSCWQRLGPCQLDTQCPLGAFCRAASDASAGSDPFTAGGGEVFLGAGLCVEDLERHCDVCRPGEACGASAIDETQRVCQRLHGSCRANDDCPSATRCVKVPVVVAAGDADGDGLADPFDNCAERANIDQRDDNGDGVGDACDATLVTPTPTPPPATATSTVSPTRSPAISSGGPAPEDDGCAVVTPTRHRNLSWALPLLLLVVALRFPALKKRRQLPPLKRGARGISSHRRLPTNRAPRERPSSEHPARGDSGAEK